MCRGIESGRIKGNKGTMDHRVQKAVDLMTEKIGEEISLAVLARLVNLSPSRFHQIFRDATGLPPATYLRQARIKHARELLENSFLSVKEIRTRVGFPDQSNFVRHFKRTYGIPPTQHRRDYLGLLNNSAPITHTESEGGEYSKEANLAQIGDAIHELSSVQYPDCSGTLAFSDSDA